MTLGGLALGAGMLVDNAIVVIESIFRNQEKGLSIKEAAINGTAEVNCFYSDYYCRLPADCLSSRSFGRTV